MFIAPPSELLPDGVHDAGLSTWRQQTPEGSLSQAQGVREDSHGDRKGSHRGEIDERQHGLRLDVPDLPGDGAPAHPELLEHGGLLRPDRMVAAVIDRLGPTTHLAEALAG